MPKDVYVAIWHLNTKTDPPGGHQVPDKLRDLGATLQTADNQFRGLGAQAGDIKVFAAPEYYFAKSGNHIRGFSEDEKDQVRAGLRSLSETYPGIVLIAGSVAWKILMNRADRAAAAQQIANTRANLPDAFGGVYKTDLANAEQAVKLGKNRFWAGSKTRWFGYNTAYVYSAGFEVGEVNKVMPYHEFSGEDPNDRITMIPGHRTGAMSMPTLEGTRPGIALKVGVEICADNSGARLKRYGADALDIQVVVSATTTVKEVACRAGGLLIHADSEKDPVVYSATRRRERYPGDLSALDMGITPGDWGPDNIERIGHDLYICKARLEDEA